MAVKTYEFQAEARQLLNLVINSIYSNKEIFLRELLSNASDAMDKLRLEALQNSELKADLSDLHITIERDEKEHTLKVIDNGIGMNAEELQNLIGTIARSGTAEFLQKASDDKSRKRLSKLAKLTRPKGTVGSLLAMALTQSRMPANCRRAPLSPFILRMLTRRTKLPITPESGLSAIWSRNIPILFPIQSR